MFYSDKYFFYFLFGINFPRQTESFSIGQTGSVLTGFSTKQNRALSLGIIDRQSVKWGTLKSLNGIDGNKKVKGIKWHVEVDKNGLLIAVMFTVTNMHDSKAAMLLMKVLKELCSSLRTIIADDEYRG